MDDEKLILLIQTHDCLFNIESRNYSDKHMKINAWEKIAAEIGKTVGDTQKNWKKIRDNYRKAVKARTDAGGKRRPIKYEKELQFLRPFVQERQQVSNLDSSSEETTQSDQNAHISSPRPQSELSNHSASTHEPVSKSSELIERFLSYKEQENKDHILSFFTSMATTVKTLPPYLQTKIKRDVFKIINDAEEQYQAAKLNDNSDVSNSHYDLPATYIPNITQHTYIPSSAKNYNTIAPSATYVPSRITTLTPTYNPSNVTQLNDVTQIQTQNNSENYY